MLVLVSSCCWKIDLAICNLFAVLCALTTCNTISLQSMQICLCRPWSGSGAHVVVTLWLILDAENLWNMLVFLGFSSAYSSSTSALSNEVKDELIGWIVAKFDMIVPVFLLLFGEEGADPAEIVALLATSRFVSTHGLRLMTGVAEKCSRGIFIWNSKKSKNLLLCQCHISSFIP